MSSRRGSDLPDFSESGRTEEQLRLWIDRYRSLITATAQVVWTTNPQGEIVEDLPAWRALTGQTEEEIKGGGWLSAIHPEDQERTAALWSRAVTTHSIYDAEYRVRTHSGEYRHFSVRGVPVLEADGSIREWVGACTDITERKQADAELRRHRDHIEELVRERTRQLEASEARYRTLFDQANDALFVYELPEAGPPGRLLEVNDVACERLGYSREELLSMSLRDVNAPESSAMFPDRFAQLRRDGWIMVEVVHQARSGRRIPVEVNTHLFVAAGKTLALCIARDITARKQADEALAQQDELNRMLLRTIPFGLAIVDEDRNILFMNDRMTERVGEGALGGLCYSVLRDDRTQCEQCPMKRAVDSDATAAHEADGMLGGRTFRVTHTRMTYEGKKAVLEVFEDVTEHHEAERQYRTLIETALDGFWIVDEQGRLLDANDAYCKMTGYTRDQLVGMRVADLEVNESPEEAAAHIQRVMRVGFDRFESRHRRRDGALIDVEVSVQIAGIRGGAMVVFIKDITARKRDEALRDARVRLLELAPGCSLKEVLQRALDEIGELTRSPIGFYHFVEPDQESLRLQAWSTRTVEEFCKAGGEGMRYRLDDAGVWADCLRQRRAVVHDDYASLPHRRGLPEGHAAIVRELVVPVMRGDSIVALVGVGNKPGHYTEADAAAASFLADVAWEIAQLRRNELVIAEQRQVFDLVFEQALAGFWDWTIPDGILLMSRRFKGVLGYEDHELPNTHSAWEKLVHPEDLPAVFERFRLHAGSRGKVPYVLELRYLHRTGSAVWISCFGTVIEWGADGKPVRMVGCHVDISERKRMERALEAARDEADRANRAKGTFLANMSHEIRTPMNAVLGFAQLLRRDPALTEQQTQYVSTILRGGEHLLKLITDILEFSKIEASHTSVDESTFDLHEVLNDLERMFRMRAEAKRLRLLVEHRAGTPRYVVTDETKLRQILQNLLANAVKFTDHGGVALRAAVEPGPDESDALRMVVEVEDSGPGIAPEEMGRLFQVFEQTESGRRGKSGTGLGLAISRKLAELLGGRLDATSRVGRGSTFRLEIPIKEGDAASVQRALKLRRVKALEPGQPPIRVLVADDKEDNRAFLEALLVSVGFEVRTVEDGARAVAEFEAWRPQLVLMDVRMPVMTGHEAILRIRQQSGGMAVKIIAVTAGAFEEDRQEAIEAGADDYVSKPFREEELFRKIQGLLGVRYRHDDEDAAALPVAPLSSAADLRDQVAALPEDLVAGLRQACLTADHGRILELTAQAEAQSPGLAREFRRLAAGFAYESLLALLGEGREA